MSSVPSCANFATDIASYGSFAFNPTAVNECVDSFDPVQAAKMFNCAIGGRHLMELYTDVGPAYADPCNRDALTEAMTDEIILTRKVELMAEPCTNMAMHFAEILDPATDTLLPGKYADFALICQCVGHFSLAFMNDNLRCGVGGHSAESVWRQCSEHTPKCEDLSCEECESKIRCSMNKNGQCMNSCPVNSGCFDDPSVNLTC